MIDASLSSKSFVEEALEICGFLDDDKRSVEHFLGCNSFGEVEKELESCMQQLKSYRERVNYEARNPLVRKELYQVLSRRLEKAKEYLGLLSKPLPIKVICIPADLTVETTGKVDVCFENKTPIQITVNIDQISIDKGLEATQGIEPPIRLDVQGFTARCMEMHLRGLAPGQHKVALKGQVYALDKEFSLSYEFMVKVKPSPPRVRIIPERVKVEVEEGQKASIKLSVENKGGGDAIVALQNPFTGEKVEVEVSSGGNRHVEFEGALPAGRHELKIPVECRSIECEVEDLEVDATVEVKPKPQPAPTPSPSTELKSPKPSGVLEGVSLQGLLDILAKHALAALAGFAVGRMFPEKVEYKKPVYVQGLPHVEQGDVTVILEDAGAVKVEDTGPYVLVRRARTDEVLSTATLQLSRALVRNFKARMVRHLKSWQPLTDEGEKFELVSEKEKDLTSVAAEELRRQAKKVGKDVPLESILESVPPLFVLENGYGYGGLLKKALVKVYTGAFSRIDRLYTYGVDSQPAELSEALEALGLEEAYRRVGDELAIFILGSPTGWSPASREVARKPSEKIKLVLIDLKSGEAYYDQRDPLLRHLVQDLLGFGPQPVLHSPQLERLDKALLSRTIDYETYRKELEKLLSSA